jgi:TfoX/Sxy family transcriptional regulator of competence genes
MKLPQTPMPWSDRQRTTSPYLCGLFCFLRLTELGCPGAAPDSRHPADALAEANKRGRGGDRLDTMKWRKSPDALIQAFDHCLPIIEGVQRRAMFGYPCAFFNGHLFCGLHQDSIIVLLSEARRDALVAEGASVFEPMPGRATSAYVVVPSEIVADRQRLRALLSDALAHASSLAPKARKKAVPSKPKAHIRKKTLARPAPAKTTPAKKARGRKVAPAKKKAARKASSGKTRSR